MTEEGGKGSLALRVSSFLLTQIHNRLDMDIQIAHSHVHIHVDKLYIDGGLTLYVIRWVTI